MDSNDICITELTIEVQNKNWSGLVSSGKSEGFNISWVVQPKEGKWTIKEAKLVTLVIRQEIDKIYLTDNDIRGLSEEQYKVNQELLERYNMVIKQINKGNGV